MINRLLITLLLLSLSVFLSIAYAENKNNIPSSEGLNQIQNTIQNAADKNGIKIRIKWSTTKSNQLKATIYSNGINKNVIFDYDELQKAAQHQIKENTFNKIYKTISQFPGGSEPPGVNK